MTSTRRRLAAVAMAASLVTLTGACDTDPAQTVDEDPQGPAEQAPGTEGPDASPETTDDE